MRGGWDAGGGGGVVVGLFGMGEESFWNTLGKWVGGGQGELGEVEDWMTTGRLNYDYRKIE